MGSPAQKRGKEWPAELAAVVVERYAAGESGEAIAEDLGLEQWWVYKLLRERGVLRTLSGAGLLRKSGEGARAAWIMGRANRGGSCAGSITAARPEPELRLRRDAVAERAVEAGAGAPLAEASRRSRSRWI